jgi:hypothetical protein
MGSVRSVALSTDVFSAIWADRQPGEETEDEILRRKYNLPKNRGLDMERDLIVQVGYHDPRFGVRLDPDFQIFRTYRGVKYTARALQGNWLLDNTGQGYASLHQLNQAVRQGNENAWNVWYYIDENGRRQPISKKRDQSKIVHRT